MRLYPLTFALLFLASCQAFNATEPVVVLIVPEIDDELIAPRSVPDRGVSTLADVGVVLADHVQALDAANGDKAAIGRILDEASQGPQ